MIIERCKIGDALKIHSIMLQEFAQEIKNYLSMNKWTFIQNLIIPLKTSCYHSRYTRNFWMFPRRTFYTFFKRYTFLNEALFKTYISQLKCK